MLKAAVDNGAQQLGLEQKIAETGGVDAGIRALDLGLGLGGLDGLVLVLLVVQDGLVFLRGGRGRVKRKSEK